MALIRLKFSKGEEIKYISHLDLQRSLHRMFRRADLDLAYSQGFNPHPKVSFAMAMPVGMTSEGEYVDVEITSPENEGEIKKSLNKAAPAGLTINKVRVYSEPVKNLSAIITQSVFRIVISLKDDCSDMLLKNAIKDVLMKKEIIIEKKNKKGKIVSKDIRPLIKDIMMESSNNEKVVLKINISVGSRENLNPQMLIDYMMENYMCFKEFPPVRVHRINMFTDKGISPIE